jgi:hypothetical protein
MELSGEKLDGELLRPQLLSGDVDGYASRAGDRRTFTVLYRDVLGRPPRSVNLVLADGSEREMERDCGTSPQAAIRFKLTLPVEKGRSWDFHFTATSGETATRYPPSGDFLGPYVPADQARAP